MPKLTGYAVVWDALSVDLGGFRETFRRGAFARSLRDGEDKFFLHSHLVDQLLGSRQAGTLKLSEDGTGLRFELEVPQTSLGGDIAELVRLRTLRGMSFAFALTSARGERWSELPDGGLLREVLEARLVEVSSTQHPAYPATSITMSGASRASPSRAAPAAAATPRPATGARAVRARGLRRLMASRLAA